MKPTKFFVLAALFVAACAPPMYLPPRGESITVGPDNFACPAGSGLVAIPASIFYQHYTHGERTPFQNEGRDVEEANIVCVRPEIAGLYKPAQPKADVTAPPAPTN